MVLCITAATLLLLQLFTPGRTLEKGIQDGWAVDDADRVLLTPEVAREMRDTGAKWVRLDFRLTARHQRWDDSLLRTYAEAVANLRREKLNVLGVVAYEAWPGGQAKWIENNREVEGGSGDNAYLRDWTQNAFRILIRRFSDVTHWEIWNEPNCWTTNAPGQKDKLPGQFFIYPSNFAWLLRHAYEEARATARKLTLVSGGLLGADFTGNQDSDAAGPYLRDTLKAGRELAGWDDLKRRYGTLPADAWGLHLYVAGGSKVAPDYFRAFPAAFEKVIESIEGPGTRKPIWVTEIGYSTPPKGLTEADQAADVTTVLDVLGQMPRIGPVIWFKLHDQGTPDMKWGLRRQDGSPKPAWEAFVKAGR